MKKNHDYLRKEFHKKTGKQSFRTQFDADIEYVVWLEAKIISFNLPVIGNEGLTNSENKKEKPEVAVLKCPECMEETTQEELDTFGGMCEECSGAFED